MNVQEVSLNSIKEVFEQLVEDKTIPNCEAFILCEEGEVFKISAFSAESICDILATISNDFAKEGKNAILFGTENNELELVARIHKGRVEVLD